MNQNKSYTARSVTATPYLVDPGVRAYTPTPINHVQPQPRRAVVIPSGTHPNRVTRVVTPQAATPYRNVPSAPSQMRYDLDFADSKRSIDKSKGLRHFSTKVCEKVKEKGRTNYNEVADELVTEYFDSQSTIQFNDDKHQYDMKNIRRRVYDALNVLLAMNIIQKNKKDIHWVGLPTSTVQEFKRIEEEKQRRQDRIREKTENLQEMIIQLVAYRTLVEKNREREREEGRPVDNSVLYLPYVIVNTEKKAMVECSVADDKSEFLFNFDHPFEIHDDVEVLKRLGLAHGLESGLVSPDHTEKVKNCLPHALRDYVDDIIQGTLVNKSNLNVTQRDIQKPVQYIIQQQADDKPATSSPAPQMIQRPIQRAPVVVRTLPGSRYTVVKPTPVVTSAPKRYHQVVVQRPNGTERIMLQAPTVAHIRQQQQQYHRQPPQPQQVVHQQQQYQYATSVQENNGEYEVYDEMEGENLDYE